MARIVIRPKARREIQAAISYYVDSAGFEVAKRFQKAAKDTLNQLAKSPHLGAARKVRRAEFHGVRMWHIRGFKSYLVFYKVREDGIAVERVIHASQDYRRMMK